MKGTYSCLGCIHYRVTNTRRWNIKCGVEAGLRCKEEELPFYDFYILLNAKDPQKVHDILMNMADKDVKRVYYA